MNVVCCLLNNTVSKSTITKFQNVQVERDLGDQWIWNSTFTYEKIESWVSFSRNNSLMIDPHLVTELIAIRTRIKPGSLWTYRGVFFFFHWIRSSLTLKSYFTHLFISLYQHQYQFTSSSTMPGFPVHYQLRKPAQTHVHRVSDGIQPSHPVRSLSPPAFNPSQHQGLFQWLNSSHEVSKVFELQLWHQSFQWTPRTDFL